MQIACPFCRGVLENRHEIAGTQVGCPHCGQVFMMPAMSAMAPMLAYPDQPKGLSTLSIIALVCGACFFLACGGCCILPMFMGGVAPAPRPAFPPRNPNDSPEPALPEPAESRPRISAISWDEAHRIYNAKLRPVGR